MERPKRRYSDQEKAAALAILDLCNGDCSEASRRSGFPRTSIQEWNAGRISHAVPDIRHEKKLELAEMFESVARQILDAAPDKVGDASLKDAMVAAAVAVDKMRLLKGQPTAITETQSLTDAERLRRLEDLASAGEDQARLGLPHRGAAGGSRPAVTAVN